MTIEEEVNQLIAFLSHKAGFNVDICGLLCIRPIDECSPPETWEVDWEDIEDGIVFSNYKAFNSLTEAAQFFVEKRHKMELGMDFEEEL